MNLGKWEQRALKKIEKMSTQQKIAFVSALNITLYNDIKYELINGDIETEVIGDIATLYGVVLNTEVEE